MSTMQLSFLQPLTAFQARLEALEAVAQDKLRAPRATKGTDSPPSQSCATCPSLQLQVLQLNQQLAKLQAHVDASLLQQAKAFQETTSQQNDSIIALQKSLHSMREHMAKQTVVVNQLTKVVKTFPTPSNPQHVDQHQCAPSGGRSTPPVVDVPPQRNHAQVTTHGRVPPCERAAGAAVPLEEPTPHT